mgnify:CR=1 FL=1
MKRVAFALLVGVFVFALAISPTTAGSERFIVKGQVSWQGHGPAGTPKWEQFIWVTLDYQNPVYGCMVKTGVWGEFACDFPSGLALPFWIEVHNGHTLSVKVKVLGSSTVNVGTLIAGDATQDNKIDKADLELCEWMMGSVCPVGGSCYLAADINDDQAVTRADCDLITANLGMEGPIRR